VGLAKFFHDLRGVAMLPVNLFVHGLHFFCGYFAGQIGEGSAQFWPAVERFLPYQWNRLVRRKVVFIIL
jgi:hypothetical protein